MSSAAGKEELTVESAMAELRATFPTLRVSVQRKEGRVAEPESASEHRFNYYRVFVGGRNWRRPTLAEVMGQVREWNKGRSVR